MKESGVKYSVFTVVMGEYSLEEVAAELKRIGYDGVEWRVHKDYHITVEEIEEKAKQVKALSDANGLEIPSLGTYLDPDNIDEVKRVLNAAKLMGCPAIRVGTPLYDGKAHYNRLLRGAVKSLRKVEKLSMDLGVKALLETHSGTIIPSASAAYRLVSNFDPKYMGIIFDPANMIIEGKENWKIGIEMLGEYLAHIHVKNIAWISSMDEGKRMWRWEYTPLDNGMVDWKEVMTVLKEIGYNRYLSLEDLYGSHFNTEGLLQETLLPKSTRRVSTVEKLKTDLNYLKTIEEELK